MLPSARTLFRPDGCFSKIMALVTHPGRVQEFSFVFAFLRNKKFLGLCLMQPHRSKHKRYLR